MASVFHMNVFRILGDVSHTASKCILIWAIHSNKSAEGVSLLTQLLYCLVFTTRYLDLFWVPPWFSWWNFVLKLFYLATSAYIVFIMMRVFARTREKEYGWKLAIWSLAGSTVSAPLVCLLFEGWKRSTLSELLWTFSIILESVCVLPQLLLLRQTSVPTVLDSFYLVTLGSYRFFYILNWIVKMFSANEHVDATSVIFGLIQTALYVDFAWVYWSRQRVKLRYGGVVDSDDLSKSFIVKRFIGKRGNQNSNEDDDITEEEDRLAEQENGNIRPGATRSPSDRWGARGISVSADDTLQEHLDHSSRDAQMVDPSHFEDDDDDDDDVDNVPPPPAKDPAPHSKASESASSAGSSSAAAAAAAVPDGESSSAAEWDK
ncbi:ER_lumen_recept-domain-containing protein [Sphaerulina musiva SO2202]|uniref:ER_lumen_recept-domain-containing protein n=1 Tax=Sphaerulina musiva (strain SO2202) TaxID=692275 RepID=M3D8V4_SPHMS|nr:ER_lumen_recept-domain-containing protein [Sphaerulina musiva SO2202]EMF14570.1 ER_lumen_recept-domain-containing protein [Sphaerulina musiva SO2202]